MKKNSNWIWILAAVVATGGLTNAEASNKNKKRKLSPNAVQTEQLAVTEEASPEDIEADLKAQGITFGSPSDSEIQGPADSTGTQNSSTPLIEIEVFKRSSKSGINKEFVLVSKNGAIYKAFVASTATEGLAPNAKTKVLEKKNTPEFQGVKLSIPYVKGIPYPWTTSSSYGNSSMYWGLQVRGGYFIHSTPHYGQLGTPASMGCIRVDFPTSMELWDIVVNEAKGNAYISIYGATYAAKGKASLAQKLHDSGLQMKDIQAMVDSDLADAHAISTGDYHGRGHKRINESSVRWPLCGAGHDCFTSFGVAQPK